LLELHFCVSGCIRFQDEGEKKKNPEQAPFLPLLKKQKEKTSWENLGDKWATDFLQDHLGIMAATLDKFAFTSVSCMI